MSESLLERIGSPGHRRELGLQQSRHNPLSSHLKISEHGVGLFEEGDKLAHCLAEVLVGHPLQGILARWRRTSSKGGGLNGSSGERHLVANQS